MSGNPKFACRKKVVNSDVNILKVVNSDLNVLTVNGSYAPVQVLL